MKKLHTIALISLLSYTTVFASEKLYDINTMKLEPFPKKMTTYPLNDNIIMKTKQYIGHKGKSNEFTKGPFRFEFKKETDFTIHMKSFMRMNKDRTVIIADELGEELIIEPTDIDGINPYGPYSVKISKKGKIITVKSSHLKDPGGKGLGGSRKDYLRSGTRTYDISDLGQIFSVLVKENEFTKFIFVGD